MFKIYYKNRTLIVSEKEIKNNYLTKIHFSDKNKIINELEQFLHNEFYENINIFGKTEEAIFEFIKTRFEFIRAAGGIVKNNSNKFLCIERLGYFDFPKGKVEEFENEGQAALREVCEECGININDLILISKLTASYHIYPHNSNYVLKETQWFNMKFTGNYNLKPQTEENISKVSWFELDELRSKFSKNTYPALVAIIGILQ